jgi:hypothetical protein
MKKIRFTFKAKENLGGPTLQIPEIDVGAHQRPTARSSSNTSSSTTFPGILQAPVYYPTAEEFKSPMAYIQRIRPVAETFGICKIVPPKNWRPPFAIDQQVSEQIFLIQLYARMHACIYI